MTQQGDLQESIRAVTGTTLDFNGDLMTLFEANNGGGTTFDEMALRYFRGLTGAQTVSEAMNRFARNNDAYNWSSLGSVTWPERTMDFIDPPLRSDLTFTRASSGWSIGLADELLKYGNNEGRWDASQEARGFLREETRANEAKSPDMSGAVIGIVGAGGALPTGWSTASLSPEFTLSVDKIGVENGFSYIDLTIFGLNDSGAEKSPSIQFMGNTDIVAAQNEWWTASLYGRSLDGAPTHASTLRIIERTATGTFITGDGSAMTFAPARNRSVFTRQLPSATAARVQSRLQWVVPNGDTLFAHVRLYAPQLEKGRFVTSPIIGPGGPNTRADDFLRVTGTDFSNFWSQLEGTVFIRGTIAHGTANAGFPRVFQVDNGTQNERYTIFYRSANNDNRLSMAVVRGGADQISTSPFFEATPNVPFNLAFAYEANNFAYYANGTQILTDNLVTLPSGVNGMGFFSNAFAATDGGNGQLFGLSYWKTRLPDIELERMTKISLPV